MNTGCLCFRADLEKLRLAIDEGRKNAVTKKNRALISANESLNKFNAELNKKIAQVLYFGKPVDEIIFIRLHIKCSCSSFH